jgi:general secretion pathway protein K
MHCHRASCSRVSRRERGAALIVAMLVFALATALVVAMKGDFERFFQRSANLLLDEQAQAYLRGAEDLAATVLIRDYDEDKAEGFPRDDRSELWNTSPPKEKPMPYALDDVGWMRGSLEDLQGRFNLNALAESPSGDPAGVPAGAAVARHTPAQEQFIRLLQALGEPELTQQEAIIITESITDWLDADAIPLLDGAEDEVYSSRTPAHRAGNRPMSSVSELLAVANMTPQIYQALRPWVTVWPAEPLPLNIHTAPAMLLRTINAKGDLNPLTPEEGEALAAEQFEPGFTDKSGFLNSAVFEGRRDSMNDIMPLLGESSEYFLLEAEAEVAGRNMRLYSVLHRHNRQIDALARASDSGSL